MVPTNNHLEANIGAKWEQFVEYESHGLLKRNNILTEYVIMREVMWQFFCQTSASFYKLNDNQLLQRSDATISSIRQVSFFQYTV